MATPRIGIEAEFTGTRLTFWNTESDAPAARKFWPVPEDQDPPIDTDHTMMQHRPILVPLAGTVYTDEGRVNWEGNWGFVVVGDTYSANIETLTLGGTTQRVGSCAFELASAAHRAEDVNHWVFLRRCYVAFRDTLKEFRNSAKSPGGVAYQSFFTGPTRWYPLENVVEAYNKKVSKLTLPPGIDVKLFQLHLSPELESMKAGIPGPEATLKKQQGKWAPYLNVWDDTFCDTQVNYTLPIERLYSHTNIWIDSWKNMWMEYADASHQPRIDPESGHRNTVVSDTAYINQDCAAMWRAARSKIDDFYQKYPIVGATTLQQQQLKALVMYLVVIGAVTPQEANQTTKNTWSQFPKTSGASIASLFADRNLGPLASANAITDAKQLAVNLRDLVFLKNFGQLPAGPPAAGKSNYETTTQAFIKPPAGLPGNFDAMWGAVFTRTAANAPTDGNTYGFTDQNPFYCWWSKGVHTSVPARTDGRSIYMTFESRFGKNRLNLAFNPDAKPDIFYVSYIKLINGIMGEDARNKVMTALDQMTNDPSYADVVGTVKSRAALYDQLDAAQKDAIH